MISDFRFLNWNMQSDSCVHVVRHISKSVQHIGGGRLGAPTVRQHASPGQRPGFHVRKNKALKGRHSVGAPLQGFVLVAHFSQCVALGWHVAGPLALSGLPVLKRMRHFMNWKPQIAVVAHAKSEIRNQKS